MNIKNFTDEDLRAAYNQLMQAKPQLPHYRRARLALIDEMERRGEAQDAIVRKAQGRVVMNEASKVLAQRFPIFRWGRR
jgi:hypothetical protein